MKNLKKSLTVRLEDGYYSITVANHRLITVIKFIAIYIFNFSFRGTCRFEAQSFFFEKKGWISLSQNCYIHPLKQGTRNKKRKIHRGPQQEHPPIFAAADQSCRKPSHLHLAQ